MKDHLPKNLIIPALFGALFFLCLFLVRNSDFLNKYPVLNLLGIFLTAITLYAFVIGGIKNPLNISVGMAGFSIARIFTALILPIGLFIYQKFFFNPKKQYKTLLEKENKILIPDSKKCFEFKYGKFTNGNDTIIRYSSVNTDFEILKSLNKESKMRIKWIDSCSYIRYNEKGVVLNLIKIGNFDHDGSFDQYSKPASLHEISDEEIYRFEKIN